MEAEAALRSLKQKIANAPKKPIKPTQPKPSGFNQNKITSSNNNKMNYAMEFDMKHSNNNPQAYKIQGQKLLIINLEEDSEVAWGVD